MSVDPRSRRVAVVADSLLEVRLGELREGGWGVMQLPPASLERDAARAWLELTAEQIAEYLRTGYEVVLLDDSTAESELAVALAAVGVGPLQSYR